MHPIWQVSIIQSPIPYFPVKTMVKQQKSADFLTNEIGCHPYNAAVEVFASLYDSSLGQTEGVDIAKWNFRKVYAFHALMISRNGCNFHGSF